MAFGSRNGQLLAEEQVSFIGTLGTSDLNVTGSGVTYVLGSGNALTVTQIGSSFTTAGIFTAPYDGFYTFSSNMQLQGIGAGNTNGQILFSGSAGIGNWLLANFAAMRRGGANDLHFPISEVRYLTAGQTRSVSTTVFGSGGSNPIDINAGSYFSGALVFRTSNP
ncbi:MAG: hypothetical protein R6V36_08620 [Psychroflexus sp.]